jgi:fucose permease
MFGSHALLLTAVCATLLVGLLQTLPNALRLPLARQLGQEEGRARGLSWAFPVSLVPAFFVSGLLVDRLGVQEGLIVGSLATAVGLASLGLSRGYRPAVGAASLTGAAVALTVTATAALLPAVVAPHPPTTAANLGYLLVGVSALATAGLVPLLDRQLGIRKCLLVLALICLLPTALASLAPENTFPQPPIRGETDNVLLDPRLWLAGLVLFLYQPLEAVVATWAPAYLGDVGRSPRGVSWVLLGFWIAFLSGRFLMALALPAFVPWVMLLLLVFAAIVIGNLSGMFHATGGTLGIWLLGGCLGPIFPSLIGAVWQTKDLGQHAGLTFGVVLTLGSFSNLTLLPLVEGVARGQPVRRTMRLIVLALLIVAAPMLVLCLVL